MPRGKRSVVQHPEVQAVWKQNFRSFSMKIGFQLNLSRAMLEMLCAIADDVQWDRALYHQGSSMPENWIASHRSLEKRGLIIKKTEEEISRSIRAYQTPQFYEFSAWKLSPAGDLVVSLVKTAGMFIEADAAINKKARERA